MPIEPVDVLRRNRREAIAAADKMGGRRVLKLLKESHADLQRRLHQARGLAGPGPDSFTAARLQVALAQVTDVAKKLTQKMRGELVDQAEASAEDAAGHVAAYLRAAERRFKGISRQGLRIDEASMLDRAVAGARSSVLRRLASTGTPAAAPEDASEGPSPAKVGILERYGVETVGAFERVLQRGVVTGAPWGEVRDSLEAESPFLEGQPRYWGERIMRTECLVAETPVSGAVVRAAFRRWYEGPVVEVITEGGRKLTTTPNHPMLTRRGWVGSGMLHERDHLICYRGKQDAGAAGHEHVEGRPPTVREVFDALAAVGVRERRRGVQPDFHGDGCDREVEVARADVALAVGMFATLHEHLVQRVLAPSDFACATFCERCHRLLSIQKQPCLCRRAWRDPIRLESIGDELLACAQGFGDAVRALACMVTAHDFIAADVEALVRGDASLRVEVQACLRARADHAAAVELTLQGVGAHAAGARDLFGAHAVDVHLDRVIQVRAREFSGHVYNLETPYGYFTINGAYTGNTMGASNRGSWESIRAADDELGDCVKILSAVFDDRTGWDSYQVHGQIRRPDEPFEWAEGAYMAPPNRPNDREVVVPHRISWPLPPYLAAVSDAAVVAAYHRQRKTGSPGPRPRMTTVPLARFGR